MGIVNINDDSFCRDGSLDVNAALAQAECMIRDGADIIDIGAESARTNREAISVEEELRRLLPFVEQWPEILMRASVGSDEKPRMDTNKHGLCQERQVSNSEDIRVYSCPSVVEKSEVPLLSINTWRNEVVERILPVGGDILNDLSALPTPRNAELCARHGAALLIMHSVGEPKVPHTHVGYEDVMQSLDVFFEEKIRLARDAGLSEEHIVLDPGIDFAKQRDDNLRILRELEQLRRFGRPILLPVSRKTVIGEVLGLPDPLDRDAGTIACIAAGMRRGADIFRVHHVAAAAQAVKVLWEVADGENDKVQKTNHKKDRSFG